ncbi:hypothetical protein FE257_005121 [Aspergillus nanangensis]|uniref:Cytochrome P450 n=1 Tax=Aspergillus nanangensis TaxID=2582783 RepID=A0AAD4CAE1_ASPNN|nr:hypothetical protein FE257_005121 [Aspergillus nanangensis]
MRSLFRVLVGIAVLIFLFLVRRLQQIRKVQRLERFHGCEPSHSERNRFRYDFLGIIKALELAFNFRCRTSLPYTNALFKKYGETYVSNVFTYRLIFTCNANNTRHLLSTAFADYDSSPLRKPMFKPITPHGIFTLDGAGWKKSREQLRSRLSNLRRIIELDSCERHFQAFLRHVPAHGRAFDVQSCVFALALDMQTAFSLGESVDALDFSQSHEKKRFLADLIFVKERIVQDGFRGPLRAFYPKRRFIQACQRSRQYVMGCLARSSSGENTEKDISDSADQALSILLANDSMSTALSGLFYCLCQDQRVVRKLRANIIETVGLKPPTWGQLGSLRYVRHVIHETMRLFPAVVLNARVANKDSTLPHGGGVDGNSPILVQKGEIVVFSTWARHRLGKDFGENPEQFYPERWEKLSGDMTGFIPFNKGPRSCPGRKFALRSGSGGCLVNTEAEHYAMIVLTYLVVRVFQTFSKVSNYNTQPWTERISMTLENENGVLIGLS